MCDITNYNIFEIKRKSKLYISIGDTFLYYNIFEIKRKSKLPSLLDLPFFIITYLKLRENQNHIRQ